MDGLLVVRKRIASDGLGAGGSRGVKEIPTTKYEYNTNTNTKYKYKYNGVMKRRRASAGLGAGGSRGAKRMSASARG